MTSPTRALTSRGPPEPGGTEARARFRIARFIMEAGVKLGLGSAALATACGSFHAFAAAVAPAEPQDRYLVAAAALFVAAKAQGTPRRARDVLNVTLRCLHPGTPPRPWTGIFGGSGTACCSASCCCCVCCASGCPWPTPHKYLLQYLLALGRWGGGPWGRVPGVSWALLRDAAAGGLRHPPPHLAAAALHLGLELCGRGAPPGTPPRWWQVLSPGLTPPALEGIVRELLGLYSLDTQVGGGLGGATPAPPPRCPSPLPLAAPRPDRRSPLPTKGRTDGAPPQTDRQTEGPPPTPDTAWDPPQNKSPPSP